MLVLRDPTNAMADFVMTQIDAAIGLFTSLLQHGAHTPRYRRNLQLLLSLRTKMVSKMSTAKTTQGSHDDTSLSDEAGNPKAEQGDREHSEEDVELLGWRTRLVDRAGHSRQTTIHTIHGSKPAMAPSQASVGSQEANNPAKDPYLGQGGATGQMGLTTVNSTSDMVRGLALVQRTLLG